MLNNLPVNSGDTGDMGLVPVSGKHSDLCHSFLRLILDILDESSPG